MTQILQDAKSTHSSEHSSGSPDEPETQRNRLCDPHSASVRASEYSSGSPDEPETQRNRVCDPHSASVRASETAQMNSPTSFNMATYYKQFPSQLNV